MLFNKLRCSSVSLRPLSADRAAGEGAGPLCQGLRHTDCQVGAGASGGGPYDEPHCWPAQSHGQIQRRRVCVQSGRIRLLSPADCGVPPSTACLPLFTLMAIKDPQKMVHNLNSVSQSAQAGSQAYLHRLYIVYRHNYALCEA